MMSDLQEVNGKYLWWYLQILEFHIDGTPGTGTKTTTKHLSVGPNMFDKPNKEAFYIVIHFLFKKLNPSRVQEVFRHCWPVLDRKADAEFRKAAFEWLQEIANEERSTFPKVAASHLLSASGPRFISLMLHLAKHVMVKLMKTFTSDGTWVPEAAAVPASSVEIEMTRFHMVKRHFQRVSVEQDSLIQDYQKRARCLENSLKNLKAEDVKYDDLLKKYENKMDLEGDLLAKIHKVRSLWAEINEALSSLEGERSVLDSVLEGRVEQYVLDGKDISVNIPTILLERLERLSQQTSIGRLYEGGQPILLPLLELLNVGLSVLCDERAKVSGPASQLHHQTLQGQAVLMNRSKESLKNTGRKLVKKDIPHVKSSIKSLEEDWVRKWSECLSHTPLISFLNEDPVLDFLSPMAPLSFEPASEASFQASIFSRYPAKLPEKPCLIQKEVETDPEFSSSLPAEYKPKDVLFTGCVASPRPVTPPGVHPETPAVAPTPGLVQSSRRRPCPPQTKTSTVMPKAQILELEYDNLASQFAEAVTMSPEDGRKSGMELEQLINMLSDPFTTKKQLPRTPESLIMDVRTSWRKAVEEGKAEKHEMFHDGLSCLIKPTTEANERNPSPELFSLGGSISADHLPCSSPLSQQGASPHSTVIWDSSQLEAFSPSSSSIIHFSIANENFPAMENDGSCICGDGPQGDQDEMEEEFLPSVVSHSPERVTTHHMAQFQLADFLPSAKRMSPGYSSCAGEKVFSLDLDQVESFSSPQRELTLPNLMTFSPMDEL
uniref:HAUS augmin-like complex subunit 6 N-terminal domain-containing protein n=1 Tax=Electrophorus electricus TaxID=8005 RepID=A0A4W4GQU6_ELEEL